MFVEQMFVSSVGRRGGKHLTNKQQAHCADETVNVYGSNPKLCNIGSGPILIK